MGAVKAPGVYSLKDGQRVIDAVAAAGGPAAGARLDLINLAARLEDGHKLYVPSDKDARAWAAGGTRPGGQAPWAPSPWEGGGTGSSAGSPGKVNLNRADAAALETLPGIGPALAARIVAYRRALGPFRRVEDVQQVPGIGPGKFREIRDLVTLE